MIKCRRILEDEHEERLKRKVCPNCSSDLVERRDIDSITISKKYKIIDHVWSCKKSPACFFVSSGANRLYFESATAPMVDFTEEYNKPIQYSSKIIRRRNGEAVCIETKSLFQ